MSEGKNFLLCWFQVVTEVKMLANRQIYLIRHFMNYLGSTSKNAKKKPQKSSKKKSQNKPWVARGILRSISIKKQALPKNVQHKKLK